MENKSQTTDNAQSKRVQTKEMDIVDCILEDHKPLKTLIKAMKNSDLSIAERVGAFEEFAPALIAHAKPEEEVLYVFLKKDEELREDGFEGDVEHQIADQLVEEIKRTKDEDLKSARIKVLAEVVEHHIQEEEDDVLPEFKKSSELEVRAKLGSQFLVEKLKYLAAGNDNVIPDPKTENQSQAKH